MRWLLALAFAFALATGAAMAKTLGPSKPAPPGFDRKAALDDIFERLKDAPNETVSRIIRDEMWGVFYTAPNEESAELLNRTIRAQRDYNFEKAMEFADQNVAAYPDYPEAWNQRAYTHFLRERFDEALADCRKVLELEPRHIGCLTGMARILIRQKKDYFEGEKVLRRAMDLYPDVYERVLLDEIPRQDL